MKKVVSMILTMALILSFSTVTAFASHSGQGNGSGEWKESGQGSNSAQGNGFGQRNGNGFSMQAMKQFSDMGGHWSSDAVQRIQSQGILQGYSDGTFQPDSAITEAELAVILNRLLEKLDSEDEDSSADDENYDNETYDGVPAWARDAVQNGFRHQYFNQNRFHSNTQCNRLSACVALAKALKLDPVTDFEDNPFTDWNLMSDEDYGYLLALYEEGYISGFPDGSFNPNKLITRAQIAKILEKLLEDEDLLNDENSDDDSAPTWDSDSEVTAEDINATSVELKWSGADDDVKVVGYKVLYEVSDKDKVKYVSGKSAVISGLAADTEYKFTVEAKDAAGNWSDDGPSVTVTTDDTADVAADTEDPTWDDDSVITAAAIGTDYVDLKWSAADDNVKVVAYQVTYELDGNDKSKYFTGKTGRISGLDADEKYIFMVEAKDADGNLSDDGPSVTVTTAKKPTVDKAAPTWPSGSELTTSSPESGVAAVAWPDAEDNTAVTGYKIYKDGKLVKTTDGNANSVNINGLTSGTEYKFTVRAFDAAGNVSSSLSDTYLYE